MLIDFSLLNGTRMTLDCDPNETIANVIPRIVSAFHLEKYNTVQLIYKGKKLIDNSEIKNLGYVQSQVVIVRALGEKQTEPTPNSNPPPQIKSNPPPSQPNAQNTSATPVNPPIIRDNDPNTTNLHTDRPPPSNNNENMPHQNTEITSKAPPVPLPDPEKWETNLQYLIEMGFNEDLSTRALIEAFNQPDRAVELIMNGQISLKEQESHEDPPPSIDQSQTPLPPPITTTSSEMQPPSLASSAQGNSRTQIPEAPNQSTQNSSQDHLPHPHIHPLPDVQSHSTADDSSNRPPDLSEIASRFPRGRLLLANTPPTDPTLDADEDFDLIRQTIIDHPLILDDIISIIQRNNADNGDPIHGIRQQMTLNSTLLLHLFGIRENEMLTVPESYTDEDIAAVRRLHGQGQFSWQEVIEAYETSEQNEEYAAAILLSMGNLD